MQPPIGAKGAGHKPLMQSADHKRGEKMQEKEIMERCRQSFSRHSATVALDTERYLVIDWRRADGSGEYYVNYIVDKQRGAFIVSGDLGESIAVWYNSVTPEKLSSWISDIGYYVGKIKCASDLYDYDSEDIIADMKAQLGDEVQDAYYYDYDSSEELWENITDEVGSSVYGETFIPSDKLCSIISKMDPDCFEWLSLCGRRINMRVYLWAVGFQMAYEQIKLQGAAKMADNISELSGLLPAT